MLKKLLIIGGVRFKVLEDYVRRSLFFYKGRKNKKIERILLPIIQKKLVYNKPNAIQGYESTGIWNTRQSIFWQWRRVREWFSEFSESYDMQ